MGSPLEDQPEHNQPERDVWQAIIEAGRTFGDVVHRLDTREASLRELPSVTARLNQYFIPPLPWRVFCILAGLPGKAWVIYLVLWRLSRMYKTRSLDVLETAGLLTVERRGRKNPQVTLRPVAELVPTPEPSP